VNDNVEHRQSQKLTQSAILERRKAAACCCGSYVYGVRKEKNMIHFVFGLLAAIGFFLLFGYAQKKGFLISWWQWLLTTLGILYAVFVAEVIYGFLAESEPRAALVMGLLTGIVAIIWGVLLRRFVFMKAA